MISKELTEKLLNRSLTTAETNNFKTYLKIAIQRLEELLCMDLSSDEPVRTYETRLGYRTVYVDPFTDLNSVKINDETVEGYTIKQNERFNGSWYNIIEFERKRTGENIVVDASWGFDSCPSDLQLVLAKLFDQGSVEQTADNSVKSKKIEDFSVTYKDSATYDEFVLANKAIIDKYAQCEKAIRHGRVGNYGLRSIYNY